MRPCAWKTAEIAMHFSTLTKHFDKAAYVWRLLGLSAQNMLTWYTYTMTVNDHINISPSNNPSKEKHFLLQKKKKKKKKEKKKKKKREYLDSVTHHKNTPISFWPP